MRKVVINRCYGGFSVSEKACDKIGAEWDGYGLMYRDDRENPDLIRAVEELGRDASGPMSNLRVVRIPDDVEYYIDDDDGVETIHEKHRIWY